MRQIVLDTETTGLSAGLGDRIVEIGAVEMVNRRLTGNHFHRYVNPERKVGAGALRVHGLTDDFLSDKPKFSEVAAALLDFIRGGELVIHNAPFDVEFLNAELARMKRGVVADHCAGVFDTLVHARELHPGRKNSLDALCERYAISNAHRKLHGALLDAELLAEVYLAMTRGQDSLAIDMGGATNAGDAIRRAARPKVPLIVRAASDIEQADHAKALEAIQKESRGRCVWLATPVTPR
ncbi:MAG: DNA polymerase III subunit epsilon [Betaproteobacteria bacterium]|nr:DNA polymerase III subunit epsilon [Betaproteobacteria bacterium]